jgi:hypothetical protein
MALVLYMNVRLSCKKLVGHKHSSLFSPAISGEENMTYVVSVIKNIFFITETAENKLECFC